MVGGYIVMGKHEENKNSALAIESCPVGLKHTAQLYSFGAGSQGSQIDPPC